MQDGNEEIQQATPAELIASDMRAVFSTAEGERVLRHLMLQFHIADSSYVMGVTNTRDLIFNEGERNVVLYILNNIGRKPEHAQALVQQMETAADEWFPKVH